jgi:hypothetical protein
MEATQRNDFFQKDQTKKEQTKRWTTWRLRLNPRSKGSPWTKDSVIVDGTRVIILVAECDEDGVGSMMSYSCPGDRVED